MPLPPIIYPSKPRRHHRKRLVVPAAPPVAGPVLVSAAYVEAVSLTLAFDRAIDIDLIDGGAITVMDGAMSFKYAATVSASLLSPTTVYLELIGIEDVPSVGIHMTATSANGIVAVEDGEAWAGVADLALPFP